MPRLRRVDCSTTGIRRKRRGRGFSYEDANGERITDEDTLTRIRELVIPPAWDEAWICPHPNGHIQATGIDAAGRKQYLYHEVWRTRRDQEKFDQMLKFAGKLPRLREGVAADLGTRGLSRERVLAGSVRLLDLGFFRVGSEEYAAENQTYGLATLKRSHVQIERDAAIFKYRAKGAKRHKQTIADPDAVRLLASLLRRKDSDPTLLAYRNGRSVVDVSAAHVNDYIKELTGGDFSAKDFRTWNATVLAAVGVAQESSNRKPTTKTAHKRIATTVTKRVAEYLGNTPAVCRASYIDPRVFDRLDSGQTIEPALARIERGTELGEFPDREKIERAVIKLIS